METPDTSNMPLPAAGPLSPFAGLEEVQRKLRHAVEDRNYGLALTLIEDQHRFFERAGRTHPETADRAHAAYELSVWALTMLRLQRDEIHRNLSYLSARRRMISSYAAAAPFSR